MNKLPTNRPQHTKLPAHSPPTKFHTQKQHTSHRQSVPKSRNSMVGVVKGGSGLFDADEVNQMLLAEQDENFYGVFEHSRSTGAKTLVKPHDQLKLTEKVILDFFYILRKIK